MNSYITAAPCLSVWTRTGKDSKDSQKSHSSEGDSIKVVVRVRPQRDTDHGLCLHADGHQNRIIMNSKPEKIYTFDFVADMEVTQESVFSRVGRSIIDACMSGYNGTIFAYGQTGSGKTFTMLGPSEDSESFQQELRGVIPRSFEYIFSLIEQQREIHGQNVAFLTKCSFLEIYNEQIFDLLDESSNGLQLRENIKKGVFVDGLIEQVVANAAEAYQVLNVGWANRTVAETSMNRESSRSHAVFTLSIQSKTLNNGVWNVKSSQLNLVDLAGSERQKDTHTSGVRLKEAGSINKSLSVLGNVIMSLVDLGHGKNRHVPYRDSRLTFLLRDSLGGNAKTCIIACVHPGSKCFGESLSTLHFARRAKMIKNKAVVNEDAEGNVIKLQAEIRRLKEALAQCKTGQIPVEPPALGEASAPSNEEALLLKNRFQQAMYFRQLAVNERAVAEEKLKLKIGAVEKMERTLRSKVMILKFRDESIKKLEKACKEKRDLSDNEKDALAEQLRGEIVQLQDQVDHPPALVKLKSENEALKCEIRLLKSSKGVHHLDIQRASELQDIYAKLVSELEPDLSTVKSDATAKETTASSVAAERQRAQMDELNEELRKLKLDLKKDKEGFEKERVELKAEIESLSTRNEQLEKVLKSQQVSVQVERETRSQIHMETIKNLTPKRVRYELRNRTVEASGTPMFNLNESIMSSASSPSERLEDSSCHQVKGALEVVSESDDLGMDIFEETIPKEMFLAIEEELRTIKSELNTFQTKMEAKDTELVNSAADLARIKSEKNQLNEILQKERQDWQSKEESMTTKLSQLKAGMNARDDHSKLLEESIKDLNVIMNGQDRIISELRQEKRHLVDEKERRVSDLSAKALKLESEVISLRQLLDANQQECARLKESEETAQSTLSFSQSQVEDLEEQLVAKEMALTQAATDLMIAEKKLATEEQNISALCQRLEEQGGKEAQLLNTVNTLKHVETELVKRTKEKEESERECASLRADASHKGQEMERICRRESELTEAYQNLKSKLHAVKKDVESKNAELNEAKERESQLCEQVQHLEVVKGTLAQELGDNQLKLQQKEAELDSLQEDFECTLQMYEDVKDQNEAITLVSKKLEAEKTNIMLELQASSTERSEAIADRDIKIADLTTMVEKLLGEVRETVALKDRQMKAQEEKMADMSNRMASRGVLSEQLDVETQKENSRLTDENAILTKRCENADKELEELNNRICCYRENIGKLQAQLSKSSEDYLLICQQNEDLKNSSKDQESELTHLKILCEEKETLYNETAMKLETSEQRVAEKTRDNVCLQKQVKDLPLLQKTLQTSSQDQLRLGEEVSRLQAILETKHEEIADLKSRNNEILEQHKRDEERVRSLTEENVRLVGHSNPNQKIHHFSSVKEKNIQLEEDNAKLRTKVEFYEARLRNLKASPHKRTALQNKENSKELCQNLAVPLAEK